MTLRDVPQTLTIVIVLATAVAGCKDSGGEQLPINVINLIDGGAGSGCIQTAFPAEEPDLDVGNPPRFLLTTSAAQQSTAGQAIVDPGDPAEAEITVDGETRQVLVELKHVWDDIPAIASQQIDTPGNEVLDVILFTQPEQPPSRFYMRITLCGFNCDERQVVYDKGADINGNYERTVFEDGDVVRIDNTCVNFGATPGIGSGTILIQ